MKTILVPTDFSKNAENALNYAIAIAKKEKHKVLLLHVYNTVVTLPSPDIPVQYYAEAFESIRESALTKLNELKKTVLKRSKIECELMIEEGLTVETIIEVGRRKKAYLVVMGTKGASGLTKVIMGSNTAKVIERINCPVIAVPEKAQFEGIKQIGYATQYHSSDMPALKRLAEMSKVFKSTIHLVHIADGAYMISTEEEYMERFKEKVKKVTKLKSIVSTVIDGDDIGKELERYFKKEGIDLLAISTKQRNFIERLFGSSITKKLVFHSKIPLMVFHHKEESVALI
jgi:nucleotide-binding universal stress UspA family protein